MKRISLFLVMSFLVSFLAACGTSTPAAQPTAPSTDGGTQPTAATGGGSGEKIIIVSSLPRTGSSKGQSDTMANAIRQRLEEANYQACDGKFTLEYLDWDDATAARGQWDEAAEAANANNAVTNPDVMVYIGTLNSGAAKISIPILNEANIAMISPANTYTGLTKPGKGEPGEPEVYYPNGTRNYTRVIPADDLQGAAGANWAKEMGVTSVFVLDDTQLYGKGLADVFASTAESNGMTVVGREGIDGKAADYRALAAKIVAANPDLVYYGGITQNNASQLWKDIRGEGYAGKMMGPDGIFEEAFISAAGNDVVEGTYITFGGVPPNKLEGKAGEWFNAYKAKFNAEPEAYAVYTYEAANVALNAINQVCAKDRAAIRDAVMGTKDFAGILGTWSFDENGDITLATLSGNIIKDGKFEFAQIIK